VEYQSFPLTVIPPLPAASFILTVILVQLAVLLPPLAKVFAATADIAYPPVRFFAPAPSRFVPPS
jgi:hypothetical protein